MFYQIFKYTGIAAQHLDAPMVEQRSHGTRVRRRVVIAPKMASVASACF